MEEFKTIVIDGGSTFFKSGFSGDEKPKSIVPSIVGKVKEYNKEYFVGEEEQSKRGICQLNHPIEHGEVKNWDDLEKLWHYIFYKELKVAPEEHLLLLTQSVFASKKDREKTCQIMFETFTFPGLSTGRETGLVLDIGDTVTHVVPIFKGNILTDAILKQDLGGRDLTDYFMKIIFEKGWEFKTESERDIATHIKETLCYVPLDFNAAMNVKEEDRKEKSYGLVHGPEINFYSQAFRTPEPLFQPSLIEIEGHGLEKMIVKSIEKINSNHQDFFKNIVLSGGSTLFNGLDQRLKKEIEKLWLQKIQK